MINKLPNSMGERLDDFISKNEDSDSGDNFSFTSMASQDQDQESPTDDDSHYQESDFEFGCVTPTSPTNDPNKSAPADVLFLNGRLLPHSFPSQSVKNTRFGHSHVRSRTSSISSKDSLMSSSSNSRSSSCSSGRTSSSENIEKRLLGSETSDEIAARRLITRNQMNRSIRLQSQVSNQRWQFIAPAPILIPSASVSRRKRSDILVPEELRSKKQVKIKKKRSSWFGLRFFRSFISTCRACHALEPSKRKAGLKGKF